MIMERSKSEIQFQTYLFIQSCDEMYNHVGVITDDVFFILLCNN